MRVMPGPVTVAAALSCVVLAAAGGSVPPDDMAVALERARALQSTARVLRNGATAGARVEALAAEAARLRADLDALVASHQRWAVALPDPRRTAAAPHLEEVEAGCARMRASLADLDRTLRSGVADRALMQSVGQSIGRQARACERALRRAQRG